MGELRMVIGELRMVIGELRPLIGELRLVNVLPGPRSRA